MPRCRSDNCKSITAGERKTQKGEFSRDFKGEVTIFEWRAGIIKCLACRQEDKEGKWREGWDD